MAGQTNIQWTQETWNPVKGCTPVSPGCLNCYAAPMSARLERMGHAAYLSLTVLHNVIRSFNGRLREDRQALSKPLRWRRPRLVFVNSMSDLFHEDVSDAFLLEVFDVMRRCPQHEFQILTKRPERLAHVAGIVPRWPLANVWIGTSVEDRERLGRVDLLRHTPVAVRFLSLEPLLGPLGSLDLTGINWVIVGGESGPRARPCDVQWVRDVMRQCANFSVPLFVKQLGAKPMSPCAAEVGQIRDSKGGDPLQWPPDLRVRQYPAEKGPARAQVRRRAKRRATN
jgi:protein gp37